MKFTEFINQLTDREFQNYARRAGVSPSYLRAHLVHAYKEPRKRLRQALVKQSRGKVSELEMLEHFGYVKVGAYMEAKPAA